MVEWYLQIRRILRDISTKARDAAEALDSGDEASAARINGYLKTDRDNLRALWEQHRDKNELANLARHIGFGERHDYEDIQLRDVPAIETRADEQLKAGDAAQPQIGFEDLLHPAVRQHAYGHYRDGDLRDAVLNAFIAVFDLIRRKTGIDMDGARLVGEVFSIREPKLILSELDTESGQNDQKGFLDIFKGAYTGIRNPKAHTLDHDLTNETAAQYLVFASLLARRVDEATVVE